MRIQDFSKEHIQAARDLWSESDGVGLNVFDDTSAALVTFLAENVGLSKVALNEEALIGAAICGSDGRRGYIHHLAVAHDARGRGVGKALVEAMLAALEGRGIGKTSIDVFVDNADAIAFWQRIGFVVRDDIHRLSFTSAARQSD